MEKTIEITNEIKKSIESMTYTEDGKTYISLGNYALDFSKKYLYLGCTKKTVKLAWINGEDQIKVQGKVSGGCMGGLKIHAEAWSYIEDIKLEMC